MTIKELLRDVSAGQSALWAMQSRKQRYMEIATCVGGMSQSNIRSTEKRSRVESAALELADMALELGPMAAEYAEKARLAEQVLQAMPSPRYQELLTRRYILRQSWSEISDAMQYTGDKSVFKAHGWALQEAQKIFLGMDTK